MQILIFNWCDLSHPRAGGAEVYTHEVARHWVASGHKVTLFGQTVPNLPDEAEHDGVKIIRRGTRFSVYREAKRWYKAHGVGKFDLVIDEVNTRPFGCPKWVKDTPVIALIHQVAKEIWSYEMSPALAIAGRYLAEPHWLRAYRDVPTLTVSKSSKDSLQEYGLRNIAIVSEGYELNEVIHESKYDVPTMVFCGRLTRNKRPDHALRAFGLVQEELPDAKFHVVGVGPMEQQLRKQARGDVTFHGRLPNARKLAVMARAHALLATSVREGWGLVVSEAASVGTPTIGYNVAGLRDSISVSNGLLVNESEEQLAEAILENITSWMKTPTPVQAGGVRPWDEVAHGILQAVAEFDIGITPRQIIDSGPISLEANSHNQSFERRAGAIQP